MPTLLPGTFVTPPATQRIQAIEGGVLALFIASGAAGLIYPVVWSRELVLVFGNTTQAISTIVTAFMAGLGLGGFVGGRLAHGRRNPLLLYGVCELLVGVLAILLPLTFNSIGEIYRVAYNATDLTLLGFIRFGLALLVVTPATFLMGMTLPLLTQFLIHTMHHAGSRLAELYAANTLGAVVGTVLAGGLLIEILGLVATSYVGVALNGLAGLGAVLLARAAGGTSPAALAARKEEVDARPAGVPVARRNLVFLATFISGFTALALEVLWTRMFAEGTGSRIYIFVIILTLYLLGIAIGSTIYKRRSSPTHDTLTALGACFGGVGIIAILTVVLSSGVLGSLPLGSLYLTLVPATLLMGYAFPLSGRLVTPRVDEAGRSVGLLYAWNTAGAILGSFAAAFVLAPTIGTNQAILGLSALSMLLGACLALGDRARRRSTRTLLAGGLLACVGVCAGIIITAPVLAHTVTENELRATGLFVSHTEDSLATVDTSGGAPQQRRLYVGGVGMTALTIDTKLMAYLPKALRPAAQDFLVIAFGMGSTYRSGLILGLRTDAVELSPSVPSQMPNFYADAAAFLHNPQGRIIIADGRNYVRLSSKHYDLVAVDPPPPIQSAGTVVLYTREFLEQGKARLNPGGVFMLWIPYGEALADFKDHVRTFRADFPHVCLIFGPGQNGVYMLGSDAPLDFAAPTVEKIFGSAAAQADLAGAPDFSPLDGAGWMAVINRNLWLRDSQVDTFAGPGPFITDDHPRTEYYLLRSLFASDTQYIDETSLRQVRAPAGQ
jgi:spermidine synthase